MLSEIERLRAQLRKSERRVANYVLAHPEQAMRASLTVLATAADVSTPTVIRFCRALGCEGFQDFKLRLAQSLASPPPPPLRQRLASPWTAAGGPLGFFDQAITTLLSVRSRLDNATLEQGAQLLNRAARIDIFGIGAAALTAADAQRQFLTLGLNASVHSDIQAQELALATVDRDRVILAIADPVAEPLLPDDATVPVLAISPPDSDFGRRATLNLSVLLPPPAAASPILVRIAHIAVIGALARSLASCVTPLRPPQNRLR